MTTDKKLGQFSVVERNRLRRGKPRKTDLRKLVSFFTLDRQDDFRIARGRERGFWFVAKTVPNISAHVTAVMVVDSSSNASIFCSISPHESQGLQTESFYGHDL